MLSALLFFILYNLYAIIPVDCSMLRTLTILPGIRISRSVHPAFMLIPGRVPRSYIRFCASTSVYMTLVHYLKGTLL